MMENNYCRLCLGEENLSHMDNSIIKCVKKEWSIKIKKDDEFSKEICQKCVKFVSKVIKFREKFNGFGDEITKVQRLLQKIVKIKDNSNVIVVEDASSMEEIETAQKTDENDAAVHSIDMNVSSSCDSISKVKESITFNTQNSMNKNRESIKSEDEDFLEFKVIKDESDNPISKSKAYPCVICAKSFKYKECLVRHQKKNHNDIWFCVQCNFHTKNKRSVTEHIRKHLNLKYYQRVCSTCFVVCQSYCDLISHRKNFHDETILQVCLLCNAKFATLDLLKKHKRVKHRTHDGGISQKNEFQSEKCNRGFQNLLVLENHQCSTMMQCGSEQATFSAKSDEAAKKNQKIVENIDEKNQASNSSPNQPTLTETNVSKKRGLDYASTSTNKKFKKTAASDNIVDQNSSEPSCILQFTGFPKIHPSSLFQLITQKMKFIKSIKVIKGKDYGLARFNDEASAKLALSKPLQIRAHKKGYSIEFTESNQCEDSYSK